MSRLEKRISLSARHRSSRGGAGSSARLEPPRARARPSVMCAWNGLSSPARPTPEHSASTCAASTPAPSDPARSPIHTTRTARPRPKVPMPSRSSSKPDSGRPARPSATASTTERSTLPTKRMVRWRFSFGVHRKSGAACAHSATKRPSSSRCGSGSGSPKNARTLSERSSSSAPGPRCSAGWGASRSAR